MATIILSRFLLDLRGLDFADRRSHMGIPYADSIISAGSFEMSNIRFNSSRILGSLGATLSSPGPPEDPSDVESRIARPYDPNTAEVEHDGLRLGITESTPLEIRP